MRRWSSKPGRNAAPISAIDCPAADGAADGAGRGSPEESRGRAGAGVDISGFSEISIRTVGVGIVFLGQDGDLCPYQVMNLRLVGVTQLFRPICLQVGRFCVSFGVITSFSDRVSRGLRNGIVPASAPGVTFCQSSQGEPETLEGSVFAQGFECILRAGGGKAARRRREGRYAELIEAHEQNQRPGTDPFTGSRQSIPESGGRHEQYFLRRGVPWKRR